MKFKDYKFWFIRRDDDGFITEAGINFYEGTYKKLKKKDPRSGIEYDSEEYVREKKLNKLELADISPRIRTRKDNSHSVIYYTSDFGQIKTDEELRDFLNQQLAKIGGREAIAEQKCQ